MSKILARAKRKYSIAINVNFSHQEYIVVTSHVHTSDIDFEHKQGGNHLKNMLQVDQS